MSGLYGSMAQWWEGRTIREQRMLMVMGATLAAFLVWLIIVRPAFAWQGAAAERRLAAANGLTEVRAALVQLSRSPATASAPSGSIEPLVQQAAAQAGLTVTTAMDASGGLGFRASNASSAQLFGWLDALDRAHGLEVNRLSIAENADATLNAEGAFAR